ncbi:MAG TPA: hypothetical protein VFC19_09365 [Candidatus Limnocylindrales bacterium]|nr:hypothetical protein [Candidatus Limnocylindrales bacterium]
MDREPREDTTVRPRPEDPAVVEAYEAARVAFELGRAIRYRGRHRRSRTRRSTSR